jgi:hypothetical protein
MSWTPRVDPKPPTRRSGLAYWAWMWRVNAVWSALCGTGAVAALVYGVIHGFGSDPGPAWIVLPLAYAMAYCSWRLSRHYFRLRDAAED